MAGDSLSVTPPALAAEADGWDPSTVATSSNRMVPWRRGLGHEWEARVFSRARLGDGCPFCANRKVLSGFNDLATTHPELAAQAAGWDPSTCMAGSNEKRRWRCALGHEWVAIVASRMAGYNCAVWVGQTPHTGFNVLATIRPDLVAEADGWDPSTVVSGSKKKLPWRCAEGHQWTATVASRTRHRGSGCPTCGNYGFSADLPGYLYLIGHATWGLLKIGVSNVPDRRIGLHMTRGWKLIDQMGPLSGFEVYALEQDVLKALAIREVARTPTSLGTFDGYTEAWQAGAFSTASIAELLQRLELGDLGNTAPQHG